MSSTYVHYGAPSSLPSDYALLSAYAAAREEEHEPETPDHVHEEPEIEEYDEEEEEEEAVYERPKPTIGRRSSFPTSCFQPLSPIVPSLPKTSPASQALPSEYTPLLVPRIEEEPEIAHHGQPPPPLHETWEESMILLKYTWPVFGTHVLEYSLVMASVVSIGHLSTTALAAITLGSMTASVSGFSIIQGFASTLDTMLPSAWTSPQPQLVGLWSQRMAVVITAILIPIYVIWFNAEPILVLLGQDPEVSRLAGVYLKYISIGLPAYAFNGISRRYFQSQGLFTVPTRLIVGVAPFNALLNYLLVWGPPPFGIGFIGAPIATAISFNLLALSSVIYGVFFVPKTAWHRLSRRTFTNLGVLVQLGLAGVGQTASEWWSWELIGLAASFLGPVSLATQSILLVSASTTFQAPFALGIAASVRIGNLLGEQNAERARIATKMSLVLALVFAVIFSTIFLVFRKNWGHLFNDDPDVVSLVAEILPLVALFQVVDGLSAVTGGIFRARGKQFTGALLNLSAYYVIGIPFGLWLTFKKDMGLHGLWIGLTVSLVYCAVFASYLCLKTDWDREVRKVLARLEKDKQHGHHDIEHHPAPPHVAVH